jgi:hypothetical protein
LHALEEASKEIMLGAILALHLDFEFGSITVTAVNEDLYLKRIFQQYPFFKQIFFQAAYVEGFRQSWSHEVDTSSQYQGFSHAR